MAVATETATTLKRKNSVNKDATREYHRELQNHRNRLDHRDRQDRQDHQDHHSRPKNHSPQVLTKKD